MLYISTDQIKLDKTKEDKISHTCIAHHASIVYDYIQQLHESNVNQLKAGLELFLQVCIFHIPI